ncbi:Putative phospholipase/carboxylesterase family protein [Bradyrhizobium sp. ORS 285]|uniref:alpha/beta hydrolase n=1 Tax=Bradyrhizobium sp. ORS 285 TaxID=115808 RepID=UPI0002406739|nr:alpha/beta hydrolase [Bradyrhizobium sp. ORS 285]CCD84873.1 putative phospholipase/carboxylesterase family protein [Bradyrhizobium sp. ORS 285]SMX55678.1 Putative phospholipase/carboxylesterase family protein [Bradyrhizobium sp. ORS 285]
MTATLSFTHRFQPGSKPGAAPLLLLHGTGGDENDLLPLGATLSPGAALLSPRGQVLEHGMPRFFRRLAEGVFDEDDVRRRALELGAFVGEARQRYGIEAPVAVGYSNGANIAAALLLLQPETLAGAVLFRAMVPLKQPPVVKLARKPVLILSGLSDPIVPASNSAQLCNQLIEAGADVTHTTLPTGHQLSQADVALARDWLAGLQQTKAA